MLRPLLAATLLAAGCAPAGAHCYHYQPQSFGAAMAQALVIGIGTAVAEDLARPSPPQPPPPPRPPHSPLFGTVRSESGERVAHAEVTLRGSTGFVELQTQTDVGGRFWFPMPLPADWYTLAVEDESAAGQTRLWLHDRRPAILDVTVRPRDSLPPD